jgi:hypothetical protein
VVRTEERTAREVSTARTAREFDARSRGEQLALSRVTAATWARSELGVGRHARSTRLAGVPWAKWRTSREGRDPSWVSSMAGQREPPWEMGRASRAEPGARSRGTGEKESSASYKGRARHGRGLG